MKNQQVTTAEAMRADFAAYLDQTRREKEAIEAKIGEAMQEKDKMMAMIASEIQGLQGQKDLMINDTQKK